MNTIMFRGNIVHFYSCSVRLVRIFDLSLLVKWIDGRVCGQ
jgi:hypothetical protein